VKVIVGVEVSGRGCVKVNVGALEAVAETVAVWVAEGGKVAVQVSVDVLVGINVLVAVPVPVDVGEIGVRVRVGKGVKEAVLVRDAVFV
jgi:hypothetical protein